MAGTVRWAGLVRNVMVGREGLDRDTLLGAVEAAGGRDPRSLLTTGNVTFDASPDEVDAITLRLEDAVSAVLGRREVVAVRSLEHLADLLATDPFAGLDPGAWAMEVSFLRHDAAPIDPALIGDAGRTRVLDVRALELVTARPPTGGNRPHGNVLLQRGTGLPATARGWGTLERIVARG
ncbi:DUF1697 domain-containing protein [Nocardioides cheoyonin]|uniref:DUF1697 domain-containing protein n=1 Tax=Nocardioides cheoyonin TaxID=3156615 RepID=UPI0032B60AFB